jgi:hypothetical protein
MGPAAAGLPDWSIGELRIITVIDILYRRDGRGPGDACIYKMGPDDVPAPLHMLHSGMKMSIDYFKIHEAPLLQLSGRFYLSFSFAFFFYFLLSPGQDK